MSHRRVIKRQEERKIIIIKSLVQYLIQRKMKNLPGFRKVTRCALCHRQPKNAC